MKAKDLPKLHHEDPSGFWKLIRTGAELPVIGQHVLVVYDIRGTAAELEYQLFQRIAAGNPYRITDEAPAGSMPAGVAALHAETLKLPTADFIPKVIKGCVDEIGYCPVMEEYFLSIQGMSYLSPEHLVYWTPMPTAPNTFTPRSDDLDVHYTDSLVRAEMIEAGL